MVTNKKKSLPHSIPSDTAVSWIGENVPKSTQFDDIYFSPTDAVAESNYVFIKGIGAPEIWQQKSEFRLAESGFGTGLNFLNTWAQWRQTSAKDQRLHFISIEAFPLSLNNLKKALEPFNELTPFIKSLLHQYPPTFLPIQNLFFDDDRVCLTIINQPIERALNEIKAPVDAWYLDGFAPKKNPDMWSAQTLHKIAKLSSDNAPIATFTAASDVRRHLEAAGCKVIKTKGFGKKRERIIAYAPPKKMNRKPSNAVNIGVIGGGVAGATLAHRLGNNGYDVTLYERHNDNELKERNNPVALISPKFILGDDPYGRFAIAAYLRSITHYDQLDELHGNIWLNPRGLAQLPTSKNDENFQRKLFANLNWPPDHLDKASPDYRGRYHDDAAPSSGLWFPKAGSINVPNLFRALRKNVPTVEAEISSLTLTDKGWLFGPKHDPHAYRCDILILACGIEAYDLLPNQPNPIIGNRGQTSLIDASHVDANLPSISGNKYVTSPFKDKDGALKRIVGASYKRTNNRLCLYSKDDHNENLDNLASDLGLEKLSGERGLTGLRATTLDHMPIAGRVPNFLSFYRLPQHRQKIVPHQLKLENYIPNFYVVTGLASRGFQTAPILSDYIVSLITGIEPPIDQGIRNQLDPARFELVKRKHALS